MTRAQCDLGPISSTRTVADGVLDKFELFKKTRECEAKPQLRSVILGSILSNSTVAHAAFYKLKVVRVLAF